MDQLFTLTGSAGIFSVDFKRGRIVRLLANKQEYIHKETGLFGVCMMDRDGKRSTYGPGDASEICLLENGAVYSGFPIGIRVEILITREKQELASLWIRVYNHSKLLVEWAEFPGLILPPLAGNGGRGKVLFPYNEGVVVDDLKLRNSTGFAFREAVYPSFGASAVFPNMICSQFLCYLNEKNGLYLGVHDPKRGVKQIDFTEEAGGTAFKIRIFGGEDFGKDFIPDCPFVLDSFNGNWQQGADLYKNWFEENLPEGLKPLCEAEDIPDWYKKLPLIVSYPIRGLHDMDKMDPNAFFPYLDALPELDRIAEKTGMQLMALLMHWEGTAPWAPPYVWPPYGGEETLNAFADKLHEKDHLLGVYCSGFGYTLKSNLVSDYDKHADFLKERSDEAVCIGPDGSSMESTICLGQRDGLDLCVGSERGQEILNAAYAPLFDSRIDYIQILDQNHGGGQYFCYSRDHEHPPVPGPWMTDTMRSFLTGWKKQAGLRLFGCESAAAEPFLPYLKFSDNRYELNWHIGKPVPLFSYLYHEYLHNFMGNQVSCGLNHREDTMTLRMAYSFLAGDAMTLVLSPTGKLMPNWGCHDLTCAPDMEHALTFAANMKKLLDAGAMEYLLYGRMLKEEAYTCGQKTVHTENGRELFFNTVFSSAWTFRNRSIRLFVNHTLQTQSVTFRGQTFDLPALDGILMEC